ncbi:MAG: di-heme oxidoredictase family protein [bacterium]
MSRRALGVLIALAAPALAQPLDPAADDAVALYRLARAEALRRATDVNEVFELVVGPGVLDELVGRRDWATLFTLGDEAFDVELPRRVGLGQGAEPPPGQPHRPAPLHLGERGGLDASSCRACHFSGGPDGAGTATQVALLRGDGLSLASATRRDAPHVMGLGWISLLARELEAELDRTRRLVIADAQALGTPQTLPLRAQGLDFGRLTATPEGRLDTSEVVGISPDLVVRPFGHKGRHADLVALADEALQIHFGLQSAARAARYADRAAEFLGTGPAFDEDADGVQSELTGAQAVLLATYLAVLPTPVLRPPTDPRLALASARGRAVFTAVGCAACHVPALRVRQTDLRLATAAGEAIEVTLPLAEAARFPRPRQIDFGAEPDDSVQVGHPVFAFTDLRRHDLGPELAEPVAEVLPDGAGAVPGSVWLTRSLWALADTAPYLHDGRARTVEEAIEWHGGEAAAARDAFRALPADDARALLLFLAGLTREPVVLVE